MAPKKAACRRPAEAFPLSEYLADELEARGWTPADVCARCSLNADRVRAILAGDRVALREAEPLALAFGVSAAMLLNLQRTYERWKSG